MLTFELAGALVGAGFASGREIASFFSQYGRWSFAGILLAAAVLVCLADNALPHSWKGRWQEHLWRGLLALLLITTGGAMLSGAGEIASLVLPVRHAYWPGMAGTLLLAWMLAHRTPGGLAMVSRVMLCVFILLIGAGLLLPAEQAVRVAEFSIPGALLRGACYGGFNAALLIPVLERSQASPAVRTRAIRRTGTLLLLLLMMGNTVLLRHPALIQEPMPFVRLLNAGGKWGYYLSAASLYLAILSTLTACMRGLGAKSLPTLGIISVALLGFEGVVEKAYSILGGACCLMLLAAKFRNCSRKAFISGRNML